MRNKTAIIHIIIFILSCLIVSFFMNYYGFFIQGEFSVIKLLINIVIIICGAYFTSSIHIILHELGHYIGGKIGGFELMSFRIGIINIYRLNDKYKIKLEHIKNNHGGICQMYPTNAENIEKAFYKNIFGGLFVSAVLVVLFGIFLILPSFIYVNRYLYIIMSMGFPISLYLFMTNSSCHLETVGLTDGAYLKAIKRRLPVGLLLIRLLIIQSVLQSGVRPRDLDEKLFEDLPILADGDYNNVIKWGVEFSYHLDRGDYEKAICCSNKIYENIDSLPEVYVNPVLIDVFYSKVVLEKDYSTAETIYNQIQEYLHATPDITVLRTEIVYLIHFCNNREKAMDLYNIAKAVKDNCFVKGIAVMEMDLIEKEFKATSNNLM